jgi:amidase
MSCPASLSVTDEPSAKATEHATPIWEDIATKKREERGNSIRIWSTKTLSVPVPALPSPSQLDVKRWPIQGGNLTERQTEITEAIPSQILEFVAEGRWTAEEVLTAFIARTTIAHYLTNPLADTFFAEGLERARYLDRYLKATGKTVGPFHGLPIILKDAFNVKGVPSTLGFVAWFDRDAESSDDLVLRLHEAGALFYCKTDVPQSLMSGECANCLFGRTSSPHNINLSAGGSSGGEGSLIALGGSPLGIGTDIAGSIRTPANFNGIYGLCPSYGRLPQRNGKCSTSNFVIQGVAGPMSRSIDGLELYTEKLLSLKPWEWDSSCISLPWNQTAYEEALARNGQKLCFGVIPHDGVVTPHPPIQRGLTEVREALLKAGHEVLEVDFFDDGEQMWEMAMKIFTCDGGKDLRQIVAKYQEPLLKETLVPDPKDQLSLEQYFYYGRRIHDLRQRYLDKWRDTSVLTPTGRPVDAFIMPSGGHVAPPHGTMEYFLYEAISNILDWTCATIPVGYVDPALDCAKDCATLEHSLSKWDDRNWEKCK